MARHSSSSSSAKPSKKANLLKHYSIKHVLDESVTEIVTSCGYVEDFWLNNLRLFSEFIIMSIALVAQFYPKKFPENRHILICCIILYVILFGLLQLIMYIKEKNVILFTHPPPGSFHTTGLVVYSKFPKVSDMYTLRIESADPKSVFANRPVELTKSVTKWFTREGVLVEGLFWKDVKGLIDKYSKGKEREKSK